jgi:hypothetical protein
LILEKIKRRMNSGNACYHSSHNLLSSHLLSKNIKIRTYKTWSLTLREEHILVFENRVPRRIFGPKRDEVTGEWRKLHNEELHNLYSSPSIIRIIRSRRMGWAEHLARMVARSNAYMILRDSQKERDHWEEQDLGGWIILS